MSSAVLIISQGACFDVSVWLGKSRIAVSEALHLALIYTIQWGSGICHVILQ